MKLFSLTIAALGILALSKKDWIASSILLTTAALIWGASER